MINKEFIQQTDELIKRVQERGIVCENGNVLVAKVKMDKITAGGIHLAEDYRQVEEYKRGFGRVLALPRLLDPKTDADLKVGDYVIYPNASPFNVYPDGMKEFLDVVKVDANTIYTVLDTDVMIRISPETIHANKL